MDLLVVGEAREWEPVPRVADRIAAGRRMALVVLGNVASEREGMRDCAQWLRGLFPGMPAEFVPTAEPSRGYAVPRGARRRLARPERREPVHWPALRHESRPLAKPNYSFEKRQRELAKKKKQDEKDARKREARDAAKAESEPGGDASKDPA